MVGHIVNPFSTPGHPKLYDCVTHVVLRLFLCMKSETVKQDGEAYTSPGAGQRRRRRSEAATWRIGPGCVRGRAAMRAGITPRGPLLYVDGAPDSRLELVRDDSALLTVAVQCLPRRAAAAADLDSSKRRTN